MRMDGGRHPIYGCCVHRIEVLEVVYLGFHISQYLSLFIVCLFGAEIVQQLVHWERVVKRLRQGWVTRSHLGRVMNIGNYLVRKLDRLSFLRRRFSCIWSLTSKNKLSKTVQVKRFVLILRWWCRYSSVFLFVILAFLRQNGRRSRDRSWKGNELSWWFGSIQCMGNDPKQCKKLPDIDGV